MLEKIKLSLRVFHAQLDTDITGNISACMLDLKRVGVAGKIADVTSTNALIIKAAELYCKWQYDFNQKGDQYRQAYENLRDALSLSDTYAEGEETDV